MMKTLHKYLSKSLYLLITVITVSTHINLSAQGTLGPALESVLNKGLTRTSTKELINILKGGSKTGIEQGVGLIKVGPITPIAPNLYKYKLPAPNPYILPPSNPYILPPSNPYILPPSNPYKLQGPNPWRLLPPYIYNLPDSIQWTLQDYSQWPKSFIYHNLVGDSLINEYCDTLSENQIRWVERNTEIVMYDPDFYNDTFLSDCSREMIVKNLVWLLGYAEALSKDMFFFDRPVVDLDRLDFSTESLWPENFEGMDRYTFINCYRDYIDVLISGVCDSLRPGQIIWIKRNMALVRFHRLFNSDEMNMDSGLPNKIIIKDLLWVLGYLDRISMTPEPDLDDVNNKLDWVVWILAQQMKHFSNYDEQ